MASDQNEHAVSGSVSINVPAADTVTAILVVNPDSKGKIAIRFLDIELGTVDSVEVAWREQSTGTLVSFAKPGASKQYAGLNVVGPVGYDLVAIAVDATGGAAVTAKVIFSGAVIRLAG